MADVKSTLDLVMERTKHLVQSEEEKKKEKLELLFKKAKGHVLGLIEKRIEPDQLTGILEEQPEAEREEMRAALVKAVGESLTVDSDYQSLLLGLAVLVGDRKMPLIQEMLEMIQKYNKERAELESSQGQAILQELKEIGISGPALRPKPETDDVYRRKIARLMATTEARLDNLRQELASNL